VDDLRGFNWADKRDNFVNGYIVPSGLDSTASYITIGQQSDKVMTQFYTLAGINTIRLGVNAPTVLDGAYYNQWKAIIEVAQAKNMKVILACWERPEEKDGKIDRRFWEMWDRLVNDFTAKDFVYFEPFNEPYGYPANEWKEIAASWMNRYKLIDQARILIGGSGYSEYLQDFACDKRFSGCIFSFHIYSWFSNAKTSAGWKAEFEKRIGNTLRNRVVVTEFGAPMQSSLDYSDTESKDTNIRFMRSSSQIMKEWNLGSIYWPGLRDEDSFSILKRDSQHNLTITNYSGLELILKSFD
jgi:hypothetical protein